MKVESLNMHKSRIFKFITFILFVIISLNASAQRGEKSLGLLGGYNTRSEGAVAGIFFQYRFNSWLKIAPDMEFLIQHNDVSSYTFNLDLHFPLLGMNRINIYPLAGVSYQSWRLKNDLDNFTENSIGIDAGAGVELKITSTLKIFAQGKYTILKHNPSGNFALGLGYVF